MNEKILNREQKRSIAKKIGKENLEQLNTIADTVKKLTYINLIEKLREINNKKEKTNEQEIKE